MMKLPRLPLAKRIQVPVANSNLHWQAGMQQAKELCSNQNKSAKRVSSSSTLVSEQRHLVALPLLITVMLDVVPLYLDALNALSTWLRSSWEPSNVPLTAKVEVAPEWFSTPLASMHMCAAWQTICGGRGK